MIIDADLSPQTKWVSNVPCYTSFTPRPTGKKATLDTAYPTFVYAKVAIVMAEGSAGFDPAAA